MEAPAGKSARKAPELLYAVPGPLCKPQWSFSQYMVLPAVKYSTGLN